MEQDRSLTQQEKSRLEEDIRRREQELDRENKAKAELAEQIKFVGFVCFVLCNFLTCLATGTWKASYWLVGRTCWTTQQSRSENSSSDDCT